MKKLSILVLSFFLFSCSKKDMVTYGTGVGTGLSGYTIFKSFMGQSGTSGNLPVMISVTTLSTLLGVYLGSEISDNMFDEKEVMNVSMNTNNQTTWSLKDEKKNKEVITTITPTENITSNFGKQQCKKFDFSMEENGFIKRGQGYSCLNSQTGNWEMLGVEML
tara:strand:+ start:284 stop:772 length:489 start_codon:yes stop_codon:yes gene_type:complete